MKKEEIEQKAEELTQEYFQKYGGITCSWGNVNQIIQIVYKKGYEQGMKEKADMLATFINVDLEKENEELKKSITEKNSSIEELEKDNECLRKLNDIICLESKMYQDQVNSLTALKEIYENMLKDKQ